MPDKINNGLYFGPRSMGKYDKHIYFHLKKWEKLAFTEYICI